MNFREINKVFGAVVLAGLVATLSGFTAQTVMTPKLLPENVYKVEVSAPASVALPSSVTAPASAAIPATAAPVETADIKPLLGAADPAKGATLAKVCAACHTFDKGGANKVGPNMWDVVGKARPHLGDGFAYSSAMKAAGGTWDYDTLNLYIANPRTSIPGNKMAYAGMKNDKDRADVIAYLRSLSDNPVPLP